MSTSLADLREQLFREGGHQTRPATHGSSWTNASLAVGVAAAAVALAVAYTTLVATPADADGDDDDADPLFQAL